MTVNIYIWKVTFVTYKIHLHKLVQNSEHRHFCQWISLYNTLVKCVFYMQSSSTFTDSALSTVVLWRPAVSGGFQADTMHPHLICGSLGPSKFASKQHLDQFSYFCTVHRCAQHTHTHTQTQTHTHTHIQTKEHDMCRNSPHPGNTGLQYKSNLTSLLNIRTHASCAIHSKCQVHTCSGSHTCRNTMSKSVPAFTLFAHGTTTLTAIQNVLNILWIIFVQQNLHYNYNNTTVLWPFVRDHLGEPVPEG